jgi:hypothetical protein
VLHHAGQQARLTERRHVRPRLDCGKQFAYDWDRMRLGAPIKRAVDTGVLRPEVPGPGN